MCDTLIIARDIVQARAWCRILNINTLSMSGKSYLVVSSRTDVIPYLEGRIWSLTIIDTEINQKILDVLTARGAPFIYTTEGSFKHD